MLTVEQDVFDLGIIKFGSIHTFEVKVTNDHPKDMVVNKVQVSCTSCTTATLTRKIKGNESAMMKITYKPGVVGNNTKWIDVVYDNDQILRVKFKALVNE